jgi:hypothetical protein
MNMKSYSVICSISYISFGTILLTSPNEFLTHFDCPLDKHGEMVARTFASSLLGNAIMHYLLSKNKKQDCSLQPLFFSNIIFNCLSAIVMTFAVFQGTMSKLGYLPVLLNLFLVAISVLMFQKTK